VSLEEQKAIVEKFWDCFNSDRSQDAVALMAEDAEFIVTGTTPLSGTKSGSRAVQEHFDRFASFLEPGARMDVLNLVGEGGTVVCLSRGRMRGRTGLDYNLSYAFVFEFSDGLIRRVTEYLDTSAVETALFGKTIA
jgi:ketosteroid isomerase-like protein